MRSVSLAAAVLLIGLLGVGCGEPTTPEGKQALKEASDELDVLVASEKAVRQYLKHPRDASFGWTHDLRTNEAKDLYFLKSTVKSPNDFGAKLTAEWATIVSVRDGQAEVLLCTIDDQTMYRSPKLDELQAEADKAASEEAEEPPPEPEPEPEREYRTWTDKSGEHQTEAELVSFAMGTVKLRKPDGQEVELSIDQLSDADQQYIRDQL